MTGFRFILYAILIFLTMPLSLHAAAPCSEEDPTHCQIDIELHKSTVKHTDRPITRVSIADPDIADYHLVTPTQVLLYSKEKIGSTNMIVWHGDDNVEIFDVHVFIPGHLVGAIQEQLRAIAPRARISMRYSPNGLILFGNVDSQETLNRVLKVVTAHVQTITNLVSIRGSQQVQLSVRIAEVSRSGIKQMGLGFLTNKDWTVGVFPSGGMAGAATASRSSSSGMVPLETTTTVTDLATNTSTSTTTTEYVDQVTDTISSGLSSASLITSPFASAFQLAVHSLNDDFLGILSILKGQNLARILASPTLVTMSGQEAEFLVGGEFPVPISGENNQTTVQYKTFGIMLRFTPMVVAPETITIQVEPEISNIDYSMAVSSGGVSVPGVRTRRGATTLQLKDGQTFVMAGLLREDVSSVTNRIPLLGDIPFLGTLFTSKEFQKNESELMIIVTPRLVRALNPDEVPKLPGEDRMGMVDDTDFFLKNRTEAPPTTDDQPAPNTPNTAQSPNKPASTDPDQAPVSTISTPVPAEPKKTSANATSTPTKPQTKVTPAPKINAIHTQPVESPSTVSDLEAPVVTDAKDQAALPPQIIGGSGFAK